MINLFEYTDYKAYLRALIKNSDIKGFNSRLAESAGCQKSYFSNSLHGKSHLLPDHIYGISEFLKLLDDEQEYLALILDYQRANLTHYKKSLLKKIQTRQAAWKDLKNRVQQKPLKSDDESVYQSYYSNYLFAALHVAVSIPVLQDLKNLSHHFGMPERLILEKLVILEQMGLVEKKNSKWLWKSGSLHLPKISPWIQNHHSNWRMQALADLPYDKSESLHYSLIQSISASDADKLRFQIIRWIEDFQKISGPSKPEELICFNLDFFNMNKI